MITLTFRPMFGESPVLVRGMHFRICTDATLRGPDNAIAARYAEGVWQLGHRQYRAFECGGPVYLRVEHRDGTRERLGPYDSLQATEGAVFTHGSCLGIHAAPLAGGTSPSLWDDIAFLSAL